MRKICRSVRHCFACSLLLASVASLPARANNSGDACCADLEQRIAELEAGGVHKGTPKVSLTLSGQVSHGLLHAHDGKHQNAYIVNNSNDQTYFQITGNAQISAGWSAGYTFVIRVNETLSGDVSQVEDDAGTDGDGPINIWEANWYLEHASLGRLTLGQAPRGSDGAPQIDLSETTIISHAGVQDVGGGFLLRRVDGALAALAWGDLLDHFNGDTANVIRWDSPGLGGFNLAASWGEDDIWDVGLFYVGAAAGVKFEAALAYTGVTDTDGAFADVEHNILVGSASVLHVGSGINATLAAGLRSFEATARDADGVLRKPKDAAYVNGKLGWTTNLTSLGATAFYGEYSMFRDFASVTGDAAVIASLAAGGGATRITGSKARIWGLGVVQHIDAGDMQIYAGYRNHRAKFDLVNAAGNKVAASRINSFHTFMSGAIIRF